MAQAALKSTVRGAEVAKQTVACLDAHPALREGATEFKNGELPHAAAAEHVRKKPLKARRGLRGRGSAAAESRAVFVADVVGLMSRPHSRRRVATGHTRGRVSRHRRQHERSLRRCAPVRGTVRRLRVVAVRRTLDSAAWRRSQCGTRHVPGCSTCGWGQSAGRGGRPEQRQHTC